MCRCLKASFEEIKCGGNIGEAVVQDTVSAGKKHFAYESGWL